MVCLLAGVAPANRPHYYQAELNIGWLFLTGPACGLPNSLRQTLKTFFDQGRGSLGLTFF